MTKRLKVAVVGTGGWGIEHARIFSTRADTELVAVVGRSLEKTISRAQKYGAKPYIDLAQMLETEKPDLVSVCLPNEGHFAPTLQIIQSGVPLLVEKPLVFDLHEADLLLTEAAKRDLFFAINFNHRFAEPVLRAKAAIDAGVIGEPIFATWRFGGEANHGTSKHANLIETQCHGFDMLEHLVGSIESVAAQMMDATYGDWSTVAIALRFRNQAVGTMLGSYDSSYAYSDSQLIEINGSLGRIVIHDTVRGLTIQTVGDETAQTWQAGYFNDEARNFKGTFDRHVEVILQALRAGEQPPVHARAGRRALQLAQSVIESHESGKKIEVHN